MPMYHVLLTHSGPEWDAGLPMEGQSLWAEHAAYMDELVDAGFVVLGGPLDAHRVVLAIEAESEGDVRETLARDPWNDTHLRVESIEPWTIRLDGR